MLFYSLPVSARYLSTFQFFEATLDGFGNYNFNIAANERKFLLELQPGTVYFISSFDAGANIAEEKFLDAISTAAAPSFIFLRDLKDEPLYRFPISLVNYAKGRSISAFTRCENNDNLLLTYRGILTQTPDLVGVMTVRVFISVHIWAVEATYYSQFFRDKPADLDRIQKVI